MIKKFKDFLAESLDESIDSLEISDDEMDLFKREPILSNLISSGKVTLTKNKIFFDGEDQELSDVLGRFFKTKNK